MACCLPICTSWRSNATANITFNPCANIVLKSHCASYNGGAGLAQSLQRLYYGLEGRSLVASRGRDFSVLICGCIGSGANPTCLMDATVLYAWLEQPTSLHQLPELQLH
jgi:hypothetical protein